MFNKLKSFFKKDTKKTAIKYAILCVFILLCSMGATYEDVADVMLSFGAVNALNLDGGATSTMIFMGKQYNRLNWVMQLHYGCKRDNNKLMYEKLGPDTGFDCINNYAPSAQMADFLNALIQTDELPKTISGKVRRVEIRKNDMEKMSK